MPFDNGERYAVDFANSLASGSRAGNIKVEKQVVCTETEHRMGKRNREEQAESWGRGRAW